MTSLPPRPALTHWEPGQLCDVDPSHGPGQVRMRGGRTACLSCGITGGIETSSGAPVATQPELNT